MQIEGKKKKGGKTQDVEGKFRRRKKRGGKESYPLILSLFFLGVGLCVFLFVGQQRGGGEPESVGVVSRTKEEEESKPGREKRQSVGENFSLFLYLYTSWWVCCATFYFAVTIEDRKEDTGEKNLLFSFPPPPDTRSLFKRRKETTLGPFSRFLLLRTFKSPSSSLLHPEGKKGER